MLTIADRIPREGAAYFADPSRLEVVKWLAVLAMVADHVGLFLYPDDAWLRQIGTFAFPAFAIAFGIGLAWSSDPLRAVFRLLLPALVAQVAWYLLDPLHGVNVLGVFLLCALVVTVERRMGALAASLVFVALGAFAVVTPMPLEGGVGGVLLVLGGYVAARGAPVFLAVAVALWFVLLPSVGFLLGVAAVVVAPRTAWQVPRQRGALAWFYAGHLFVLASLVGGFACETV